MQRMLMISVALFAVVIAAYWPSFHHGFVDLDDPEYIRNNDIVQRGLTVEGIAWAFTTGHVSNWHPITWLSLMIDAEVQRRWPSIVGLAFSRDANGLFPGAIHLTNVLLHAVNAMLLFGLLRSMTGALWRSAFVAAVFALHPIHVESVAWIAERKDVLSMLFMLLTIRAYLFYMRDRDGRSYVLMAVLFALALMSKPMVVTLPCVLLLLDVWPLRRIESGMPVADRAHTAGRLIIEKLPLLAMAVAASIITVRVQHGAGELDDGVWTPYGVRAINAAVSYLLYISKMFWPSNLAVLYPNPSHIGRESWPIVTGVAAAAVLLVATTLIVIMSWRRREQRYLLTGWLWYLGTLVPVIGFVQIGRHLMADRYAYVPFIGLYIMVAWGIGDLTSRWRQRRLPLAVIAGLVLLACGIATRQQLHHWRDSSALFDRALNVTADNWMIHNNYAAVMESQGRLRDAEQELLKAIAIYPEGASLRINLGTLYALKMKAFYEAQSQFEKAVELNPEYAKAHHNLAVVLSRRNQPLRSLHHAARAVELKPDVPEFRLTLATLLAASGRFDEAVAQLEQARVLEPAKSADYDRLISQFKSRIAPADPDGP